MSPTSSSGPAFPNGWQQATRYPDPAIVALDPSFEKYWVKLACVERLFTGCRWAEGPVYFGDGRYLLWSDIPNNRILKWEEETGAVSIFRKPSNFANGNWRSNQVQKLGVDLAVCTNNLKCQSQLQATAVRNVANRRCMEIGGVWIDEAFTGDTKTLAVKSQSDAYFRLLERQPQLKDLFRLGNHLVWMAPNGTALVIDTEEGQDRLTDAEIDALFAMR